MIIKVATLGDKWLNATQVQQLLNNTDPSVEIFLDFKHEGPSIQALGLVDMLDRHCAQTGRDTGSISIVKNPNVTEQTPYRNLTTGIRGLSHFFEMTKDYWTAAIPASEGAQPFAYFMGRRTFSRARMLYDLWHDNQTLLSVMNTASAPPWVDDSGINLEKRDDWIDSTVVDWINHCPVNSIDSHAVKDQYVRHPVTNRDILAHYGRFQVEIVAETFTIGDTFFPTEKTLRPVMAAKPVLIYGPRNFLQRLRDLGFETYNAFWDESYDQFEGPPRWNLIKQIMPTVVFNSDVQAVADRNRLHLKNLINGQV
jgi:hypothetical protein